MPDLDITGYQEVITLNCGYSHIYWSIHHVKNLQVINIISAPDIFHNYFKKLHEPKLGELAYSLGEITTYF